MSQQMPLRRALGLLASLLILPLLVLGLTSTPAAAQTVVNHTFHTPVNLQVNPCTPGPDPDIVNLNGDVHVVITSTASNGGGYRMNNLLNSQFSGNSIVTGAGYVNSEDQSDTWFAQPPFPVVHTHTYAFNLVSKSGTPNYLVHMTMHETVNSNGVPTAVVDNWRMDCQG
jgi:hypothetical protein